MAPPKFRGYGLTGQGKTPEFTKKDKIHEFFVSPLFLVSFARATPDWFSDYRACPCILACCSRIDFVKAARLQSELCTKKKKKSYNFLAKNAPKFPPKF